MATLTLIGEPFPDCEAAAHAEAARELTRAIAETAPRGCSARLLVASDRPAPAFENARASTERLPLNAAMLPMLWRTGVTARPLDGEMVHAVTPLVALRARGEDDGSQSSVMVPHALGWLAPDAMGAATARQYRAFVKRAVKHADVVLTPTHATASALQDRYGTDIVVQVLPLAAPPSFLPAEDSAARRAALGLPGRYLVTTAVPGEAGRLEWLLQTLVSDPSLPPLVVLVGSMPAEHAAEQTHESGSDESGHGGMAQTSAASAAPKQASQPDHADQTADSVAAAIPDALRGRVHVVRPRELADIGAVLSGATLLALPQTLIGTGYEVLGALSAGVPVLHGGCAAVAELALDAGVAASDAQSFAAELVRLCAAGPERDQLGVLAQDRSRSFTWAGTAMSLWELHANI